MQQLKFSTNPNGKLFADVFGDIRLADNEKFMAGNFVEIWLGKTCIGIAEIMGYKEFSFKRITDTLAIMNCGKGAGYQATLLKKFYGNIDSDALLMHIVLKWSNRYMLQQDILMEDWWRVKQEQFPQSKIYAND